MRYVGTGATGVKADSNTVPSEHFTLSTMVIPAGHEGPLHTHLDVEEVFFMLQGQMTCYMEKDGERIERTLGARDAISVPAGGGRGERNDGDEGAMMIVIGCGGTAQTGRRITSDAQKEWARASRSCRSILKTARCSASSATNSPAVVRPKAQQL